MNPMPSLGACPADSEEIALLTRLADAALDYVAGNPHRAGGATCTAIVVGKLSGCRTTAVLTEHHARHASETAGRRHSQCGFQNPHAPAGATVHTVCKCRIRRVPR